MVCGESSLLAGVLAAREGEEMAETDSPTTGQETIEHDVPINVGGNRYVVKGVERIADRFAEDGGLCVIMGCERCETSCVGGHEGLPGALCACCTEYHASGPHKPLLRAARLIETLQDRGVLPQRFSADMLAARSASYTEDEFQANQVRIEDLLRPVDDPLSVRMRPANHILPSMRPHDPSPTIEALATGRSNPLRMAI